MRGRGEKRCGACVASRGIVQSDEGGGNRQAGREEVARRGGARGTQLLGEGEKTTEEEAGWAACWLGRPARPLGCTGVRRQVVQVGFSPFCFLF